ncbi:MAG: hypothetical protein PHI24_09105 [Desulfitobacteriaceae bacterium]|nr:hypothetical protein [Desulfitobacteriaceae bacterium]
MAKSKRQKKSHAIYKQEGRREKNKARKIAKQLKMQAKKAVKLERRAIRVAAETIQV